MTEYSDTSAFWQFNKVTHFAYLFYDRVAPVLRSEISDYEQLCFKTIKETDAKALYYVEHNRRKRAVREMTEASSRLATHLMVRWKELEKQLLVDYMDGNVKTPREVPAGYKYYAPKVEWPGYDEKWMRSVVNEAGDKLKVPSENK